MCTKSSTRSFRSWTSRQRIPPLLCASTSFRMQRPSRCSSHCRPCSNSLFRHTQHKCLGFQAARAPMEGFPTQQVGYGTPYGSFHPLGANTSGLLGGVPGRSPLRSPMATMNFGTTAAARAMNSSPAETTHLPLPVDPEDRGAVDVASQERVEQLSSAALGQLSAATGTARPARRCPCFSRYCFE